MSIFKEGSVYPPVEHQARIERYRTNRRLFEGRHHEVFTKYNLNSNDTIYIAMNVCSLICKKGADYLFGEDVRVLAKNGAEDTQLAIDDIKEENDLNIKNYESALSNGYRGDSFYKIRYGQEYGGSFSKEVDPYRVIVENQNPMHVFPVTSPYNKNKFEYFPVAVPVRTADGWILSVEEHHPGAIVYYQKYMTATLTEADQAGNTIIKEWKVGKEVEGTREIVNTGVPMPLIVHVPNYSTDDSWEGIDDLTELVPLVDELNNRLTQIASILDKHADPALALPNGTIGEDENGNIVFNVALNKVFEIDGKEDVMPQYITWNGQLVEAFKEVELLLKQIYTLAEIPAVVLGDGESGTSGNSGLAIQMQMNSLLSKINRKRQYYEAGLKKVFLIAQTLETVVGEEDYDVTIPRLVFRSGLPKDYTSEANVMNVRSGGKSTKSVKSLLMEHDGMTEIEADKEIERMRKEGELINAMAPKDPVKKVEKDSEETTEEPEKDENKE